MFSSQDVSGKDSGRCFKRWSSAGLLLALMVVPLLSQTERGNITGQVKDRTGAAVPGAEVAAVNAATNVQAATQSTGAGEYTGR